MINIANSFSIIIPHKNCPLLLQRCLDSIPVRENIQVIVVDDNSDSTIVDFDNFPGIDREDVTIIYTKEGKGAGYARNIGLGYATGEWVVFADADDYFFSQELIKLFELNIPYEVKVVLFKFKFFLKDGSFFIYPDIQSSDSSVDNSLIVSYDTNDLCRNAVMPWAKMVRRSHLINNNIRFDEVKWGNDMIYSTRLSLSIDSYLIAPLLVYSHEWYSSSLVNKEPGLEMFFKRALLSLKRAILLQRGGKLDFNIFADQWYQKVYCLSYPHSVLLKFRSFLQLGPKYCFKNWMQFTQKPLYLTRQFIKRLIRR